MKFLIYILATINAFAIEFELIAKIPTKVSNDYMSKFYDRNDGSFIFIGEIGYLVHSSGRFFEFNHSKIETQLKTNTYIQNDNGKAVTFKEEVTFNYTIKNTGFVMLKTANQNNFIKEEQIQENRKTVLYSIFQSKTNIASQSSINEYYNLYSKQNYKGEVLETKKTKTNLLGPNTGPNPDFQGFTSNRSVITTEYKDGYIYFYRLTDSDLLSSPNRITLGSSQNGLLTATVNNPEQALLNIQSSTNLIDWNTFQTIRNEPSLEIVVPANQPKEFIRAIE